MYDESAWSFDYFLRPCKKVLRPRMRYKRYTRLSLSFTQYITTLFVLCTYINLNLRGQKVSPLQLAVSRGILLSSDARNRKIDDRVAQLGANRRKTRLVRGTVFAAGCCATARENAPETTKNTGRLFLSLGRRTKGPLICSRATLDLNTPRPERFAEIRRSLVGHDSGHRSRLDSK